MYKQDDWNDIVKLFIYDLSKDVSLDQALQYFASNYTEICQRFEEECSEDISEEFQEEPLDVYFERKMKPMWDYVYNLQKRVNSLESRSTQKYGLSTDSKVYPNWNIPQTRCDANGNVPLSTVGDVGAFGSAGDGGSGRMGAGSNGGSGPGFATSGYMQSVDQKYTPEQIKEWSNIRYTPSEGS